MHPFEKLSGNIDLCSKLCSVYVASVLRPWLDPAEGSTIETTQVTVPNRQVGQVDKISGKVEYWNNIVKQYSHAQL